MSQPIKRLESLDILRGFDLFLLVALQPILMQLGKVWDAPAYHALLYQFEHESWEGFRLWDLIMPLFLFMTGITIPFSMDSKIGVANKKIYKQLLRRFIILWVLGMVIQGNLLAFDWQQLKLYSNTLQAIATGYLFTALMYMHLSYRAMIGVSMALLIIYALPFHFLQDYSFHHNFAMQMDKKVLGSFMDGVKYDESGVWSYSEWYHYTWIWSSLTFVVTVSMGCFAGRWIKRYSEYPSKVMKYLIYSGVLCLITSLLWSIDLPIIKKIWTSSMTLFSGGICFLLMALFYYIIDIKRQVKWFRWLKIFGMNSIVAYFIGQFINFSSVVHSITYGLESQFQTYTNLIVIIGNIALVVLILYIMYKQRWFIKI